MGTVHPFSQKHDLSRQVSYVEIGKSKSNIPSSFLAIILNKNLPPDQKIRAIHLIKEFASDYKGGIHRLRIQIQDREIHIYPDVQNSHIPDQSEGTMTTMIRVCRKLKNSLGIHCGNFFNDRLLPFKERKP